MLKELLEELSQIASGNQNENTLVLFNDDIHSFDFVIESLVHICDHTVEQAEQCALITHFKGKCAIKSGAEKQLLPMKKALRNRELKVDIL